MLRVSVYRWPGLDALMDQADALELRPGSIGYKSAVLYINAISHLRRFPHPSTQTMADALSEILYHNLVFVTFAPPALSITLHLTTVENIFQQALILIPVNWLTLFQEDPIYQLGSVLHTGSQAVDFYNGRLTRDPKSSRALAQAHQAELLKWTRHEIPVYQLTPQQKRVLKKFPEGLNSPKAKELLYPLAPVEAIEA